MKFFFTKFMSFIWIRIYIKMKWILSRKYKLFEFFKERHNLTNIMWNMLPPPSLCEINILIPKVLNFELWKIIIKPAQEWKKGGGGGVFFITFDGIFKMNNLQFCFHEKKCFFFPNLNKYVCTAKIVSRGWGRKSLKQGGRDNWPWNGGRRIWCYIYTPETGHWI